MLEPAIYRIKTSIKDVLISPERYTISGIPIVYSSGRDESNWEEWETILEQVLPVLDNAGWLDDLRRIEIGSGYVDGDKEATYDWYSQTVSFQDRISLCGPPYLVSDDITYAVIHELAHHNHIKQFVDNPFKDDLTHGDVGDWDMLSQSIVERAVSGRAGHDRMEAVAEIAAAKVVGRELADSVQEIYHNLRGPPIPDQLVECYEEI